MATVDFVFQPTNQFVTGDPTPRHYTRVTEGTGIQTSIPLTFTISAAQATDTVITFGLNGVFYRDFNHATGETRMIDAPRVNSGDVNEQYDVDSTRQVIIPAGQTTVTFHLALAADNQVEFDEYFNLYIADVSDGHTVDASDVLANHQSSWSTNTGSPSQMDHTHSFGFNTFVIDNDDSAQSTSSVYVGHWSDEFISRRSTVFAGAGNDLVQTTNGNDVVLAHDGNDSVNAFAGDDAVHGGAGDDQLSGGAGSDVMFGGLGEDRLRGEDGNDILWGGGPTDDASHDHFDGGNGDDTMLGQGGDDRLLGGAGSDSIDGGSGADTILAEDGNDIAFGGAGNDSIAGQAGDDVLWGEGNDGSATGHDGIDGGDGNDTLLGQAGDDVLLGQAGYDAIAGGDGADYIRGGAGADVLAGGNGADRYVFGAGDNGDIVIDFNAGGVRDTINLIAYFDATGYTGSDPRGAGLLQVLQNGADTDIMLNGTLMVRLQNIVAAAVDDTYFLFQ